MIFIFWVLTIVYLKVVTKLSFDNEISVLAAIIASTLYAWLLLSAQLSAARSLDARPLYFAADVGAFIKVLVVPFGLAILVSVGLSLAVVYGFSARFSRELFTSYRSSENLVHFSLLVSLPGLFHAFVSASLLRAALRSRW